jgi:uncharacterized RDD family membrane protein YckC
MRPLRLFSALYCEYRTSMQENATTPPKIPSIRRRLASLLYESLLIIAVWVVAGFAYIPIFGNTDEPFGKAAFQLYLLVVLMIYFLTFWTRGGQTLPMKTWRIRLTDLSGATISIPRGILRFSLAFLGLACFGLGFLWAFFDSHRQFLHDRLAKTRLITTN